MSVSNGFNASGAVYRIDCDAYDNSTLLLVHNYFQTYIRQETAGLVTFTMLQPLSASSITGVDLYFTITRTNSTHNEPVSGLLGCIIEDIS